MRDGLEFKCDMVSLLFFLPMLRLPYIKPKWNYLKNRACWISVCCCIRESKVNELAYSCVEKKNNIIQKTKKTQSRICYDAAFLSHQIWKEQVFKLLVHWPILRPYFWVKKSNFPLTGSNLCPPHETHVVSFKVNVGEKKKERRNKEYNRNLKFFFIWLLLHFIALLVGVVERLVPIFHAVKVAHSRPAPPCPFNLTEMSGNLVYSHRDDRSITEL